MIGTAEDRKHLDRLTRERIVRKYGQLAQIAVSESRIEAFYREVEAGDGWTEEAADELIRDIHRDFRLLTELIQND